jgi:hypothetical protein
MSSPEWTTPIAALALLISLGQWLQSQRSNRLKALQGDKETLGFEAATIVHRPRWKQQIPGWRISTGVLRALILSTVFESSDRARVQVYTALDKLRSSHEAQIVSFRAYLGETLDRYNDLKDKESTAIIDTSSFRKRLAQLDTALPWIVRATDKTSNAIRGSV